MSDYKIVMLACGALSILVLVCATFGWYDKTRGNQEQIMILAVWFGIIGIILG